MTTRPRPCPLAATASWRSIRKPIGWGSGSSTSRVTFSSTATGWSARAGIWLERNHGGTITVANPALIRAGGASLLAIGNNSAVEIDELVTPQIDRAAIAYDDLTDGADSAVEIGLLLLDNRAVSLVNVNASESCRSRHRGRSLGA